MNKKMNYYELLEVDPEATEIEIKRAYTRKIRKYPNETHPTEFQLITKAYKTLSDSDKRAEYDRTGQNDGLYDHLMNEVQVEINRENHFAALRILDEVIANYPNDPFARFQKVHALLGLERFHEAKTIINQLRLEGPNNEDYLETSALVYYRMEDYDHCIELLNKLISLNPDESNYYLRLSNAYFKLNQVDNSIEALEKKLRKGESVHDFPLLLELFYLSIVKGDKYLRNSIRERLRRLPISENEKQLMIDWLINECDEISHEHTGYADLVRVIRHINGNQYDYVNKWLQEANNLISSTHQYSRQQQETAATTTRSSQYDDDEDEERGSIVFAIILGIIASFFTTPIGGIVIGFIYYFFAKQIKQLLSCLGCLIMILIAIAIGSNLL